MLAVLGMQPSDDTVLTLPAEDASTPPLPPLTVDNDSSSRGSFGSGGKTKCNVSASFTTRRTSTDSGNSIPCSARALRGFASIRARYSGSRSQIASPGR